MNIGRLDRPITLQRPVKTLDEYRAARVIWEDVATVWATFTPASSRTRMEAPKPLPIHAASFVLRYRQVEGSWRVMHDGQPWRITGISEMGRREGIILTCERADPDGSN